MKYLIILIIVLIVLAWLRHQARRGTDDPSRPLATPPKNKPDLATPQDMVRCARCGLHVPASDALNGTDGRAYCSRAHRDQTEA